MSKPHGRLRPFDVWGYEIFVDDFTITGEVTIWSRSPLPPRLGELLNIETDGVLHELAVDQITTFKGGWTASCRVEPT